MKKITLIVFALWQFTNAQPVPQLWGLCRNGGATNGGTIFKINANGTGYAQVYSFVNPSVTGWGPQNGNNLVQARNGKLYGLTYNGGTGGNGVVFKFDPVTNTYTKIHDFAASEAGGWGDLLEATNGKFYSYCNSGGAFGRGYIFSLDIATNAYTNVWDFNGTNGGGAIGTMIQLSNGLIYGFTAFGGTNNQGTIFSFDPAVNTASVLYNFTDSILYGKSPNEGPVHAFYNGKFYGMTAQGGTTTWYGVIFSYDLLTGTFAKLHDFQATATDGGYAFGGLFQASNGMLYGLSQGGANGTGIIFRFDPATNLLLDLRDLGGTGDGAQPTGELIQVNCAANYSLYADAAPHTYNVVNMANGVQPIVYDWNWGDGSPHSTTAYPSHTYAAAGFYNICLTITDATGCSSNYCNSYNLLKMDAANAMVYINVIAAASPVGIPDNTFDDSFSFSPNPATNELRIKNSEFRIESVEIYDLVGEKILQRSTHGENKVVVDVSSLPSGIYFVSVRDEKNNLVVRKIVKM